MQSSNPAYVTAVDLLWQRRWCHLRQEFQYYRYEIMKLTQLVTTVIFQTQYFGKNVWIFVIFSSIFVFEMDLWEIRIQDCHNKFLIDISAYTLLYIYILKGATITELKNDQEEEISQQNTGGGEALLMNNGSRDTSHSDIQKLQQQLQDIKEQVNYRFLLCNHIFYYNN